MIFEKYQIFEHVNKNCLQAINNTLWFTSTKNETNKLWMIDSKNQAEIELNEPIQNLFIGEEKTLLITESYKGILLDTKFNQTLLPEDIKYSGPDGFNDLLIYYRGGLFNQTSGTYSISKSKLLFETSSFIGHTLIDNLLFEDSNGTIACRKAENGELIWKSNLLENTKLVMNNSKFEKPIEVDDFIGIYKSILWINISNGIIVALNKQNGEVIHLIGPASNNTTETELFNNKGHAYLSRHYKLEHSTGLIILLSGSNYFEIDLNTTEPQKKWVDISTKFNDLVIRCDMGGSSGFQFDNDYIYFYDGNNSKIGILDRTNLEIKHVQHIDVQSNDSFILTYLTELRIIDGHIFVLDRNNDLHRFKIQP